MKNSFLNLSKNWDLPKFELVEFKKRKNKYCLCIPVINEGNRIIKQLKNLKSYTKIVDILILDGDSTDNSLKRSFLKKIGISALLIKKSVGRQSTQLRMGFAYAMQQEYEGIIIMDGNGKDGPEAIPRFIKALDQGYGYIQGSRFLKGGKAINTPPLRWIGIRLLFSPILSIPSLFWFTDITNGFRACSRQYLLNSKLNPFREIFSKYELLFYLPVRAKQIGFKVCEIPVTRGYPKNEIPSKIKSFSSHINLLSTVLKTALGFYNPK